MIPLSVFFPGAKDKVRAYWYSDTLRLGRYSDSLETESTEAILVVKEGKVVSYGMGKCRCTEANCYLFNTQNKECLGDSLYERLNSLKFDDYDFQREKFVFDSTEYDELLKCENQNPPKSRENDSCSMILDDIDDFLFEQGSHCLVKQEPQSKGADSCLAIIEKGSVRYSREGRSKMIEDRFKRNIERGIYKPFPDLDKYYSKRNHCKGKRLGE